MTLPHLTYLTVDSMSEWVGLSQVVPYVERLAARGMNVTLHSFERSEPDPGVTAHLAETGVDWRPHRFGPTGAAGGAARVVRGARLVAGAELVHARSDLAAASCLLARSSAWVWDMRAFWREERIHQGLLRPNSPEDRVMGRIEAGAANNSTAIVTLSAAAIRVLADRHGLAVEPKACVITTCVDLDRFPLTPLPPSPPIRFLLTGTLNRLYDVRTMIRIVERATARCPAELSVLTADAGAWTRQLQTAGATIGRASRAEMPAHVQDSHVGLSLRRLDAGSSGLAATPTKLGEFLATGRPVIVNKGLGDMDDLLPRHRCGAILQASSDQAIDLVVHQILDLLADPDTPDRCRALADEHFDVERGVDALMAAYQEVNASQAGQGRQARPEPPSV